ncbi:MAG: Nif3-like dinuclear metal center hexameric protein [Desulfohalobiaceae bacterium]|nr:Nif3-like dinuclear metal center hexameric protein [Desulfohalobiaceae bacterium]
MQVSLLKSLIEKFADPRLSAKWDRGGTQIAGTKNEIEKLAVTLDPSAESVQEALNWKADFILTHHPLSLAPGLPDRESAYTTVLRRVLSSGAWLYSAHTSLDVQTRGPVSWLAAAMDLERILPIEAVPSPSLIKLSLPGVEPPEELLQALERAEPVSGISSRGGSLEVVLSRDAKYLVCSILRDFFPDRSAELVELFALNQNCGYGVIGNLNPPLTRIEFQKKLYRILHTDHLLTVGAFPDIVSRLAYCPGSGMSLAPKAFALDADVFISGDLKFHQAQEIEALGLTVDAGHFALEEPMMAACCKELESTLGDQVQVRFFPGRNPFHISTRIPWE